MPDEATGSTVPMYGHSAGQNRARNLIAAGAGFMIAAAVTTGIAMTHREPCYGSDVPKGKGPTIVAAGVGAVGLAAVVGATTWYVRDRRQHDYRVTTRQRLIAGGMGTLSFVLIQAMLGSLLLADQLC
jgi:Zn-dependent alcohol dehydrogenase